MKKYSLIAAIALSMAACQSKNEATTTNTTTETTTATDTKMASAQTAATPAATTSAKIKDPVCGMEMEGEHFTEFTTSGTDTTWFCSPHCKDQYMKNPEKYKKPTEAPKG